MRQVIQATLDELTRVGYGAMRVEEVALAAGVNKTTIYRRWPTKRVLVAEALRCHREQESGPPDTGTLRGDLCAMMRTFIERSSTPFAFAWLSEIGNSEVRAIMEGHRAHFEAEWSQIIARGMARRELPAKTSPLFFLEVLVAPIIGRLTRGERDLTIEFCDQLIDFVIAGTRAFVR